MEDEPDILSLLDETDVEMLMHRDAHFGGKFDIMMKYYNDGGKGINPDFALDRMIELAALEENMKQNLAAMLLSGPDAEKVGRARNSYKQLRSLYEVENPKSLYPTLIADLILSEEEVPQKEIDAIVAEKQAIVPALIELIKSEDLYDPLFPGYGLAPTLIYQCLGLIGDKRAIISLFESIGHGDFFDDEVALKALRGIGNPARDFLLKVVHARPITEDNERAAIALVQFKDDPEVAKTCFQMLKEINIKEEFSIAIYLALACEGLDASLRPEFIAFSKADNLPRDLKEDMKTVITSWTER